MITNDEWNPNTKSLSDTSFKDILAKLAIQASVINEIVKEFCRRRVF